ncbi:hypothetical protein ACHAWF_015425 [Thalassiosira exigua]
MANEEANGLPLPLPLPRFIGIGAPSIVTPAGSDSSLDGLQEEKAKLENMSLLPRARAKPTQRQRFEEPKVASGRQDARLNKFVRRLHELLTVERHGGVVEWRRGVLILHSIDRFSKEILPKYFNTRNFKTFRRQLNYYAEHSVVEMQLAEGRLCNLFDDRADPTAFDANKKGFLRVRSFSTSSATTALWVNLKRVELNDSSKTPEGRRERKSGAASSVENKGLERLRGSISCLADVNRAQPNCFPTVPRPAAPPTCPLPKIIHHEHVASVNVPRKDVSFNRQDPLLDHAAGLLLSLSHGAM